MNDPTFGFLGVTSGSLEGAIIRDARLANTLHRRGFRVVMYWMVQQNRGLIDPGIRQRVLCRAMRYATSRPTAVGEIAGALFDLLPADRRRTFLQTHPRIAQHIARNFTGVMCDGGAGDPRLVARLERFMRRDGVTHLLPTFAFACPFARTARARGRHPFEYVVTFQAEELFVGYARELGREADYFARLREAVGGSPWKAVAVSDDYVARLEEEMGVDAASLVAICPGIELPAPTNGGRPDWEVVRQGFPRLRPDRPIVTFVGRNDAEKGIDLLLYAARMLRQKGLDFQLAVAGGTTFGSRYRQACEELAGHLRLDVHWHGQIQPAARDALYAVSRCVVYPPVHREPFGMVAAEALSQGTPVVVPDHGGLTEAIRHDGRVAGLTFRVWDSGDLAAQIERLLVDDALHAELAVNAREVASGFDVEAMADRLLAHLDLPATPVAARCGERVAPRLGPGFEEVATSALP